MTDSASTGEETCKAQAGRRPALRAAALRAGAMLALVALAVLPFVPSLSSYGLWDDGLYITENTLLEGGAASLQAIWLGREPMPDYYPVTHSVLWAQHQFWGDAILGYRIFNLVLHALGTLALCWALIAWRLPGGFAAAWLTAALWAVHPLQVDTVAWASQQKATLSLLFGALAAGAYARHLASFRIRWYLLAWGCFVLGMLSKTDLATLPAVLLLLDAWRGRELATAGARLRDPAAIPAPPAATTLAQRLPWMVLRTVPFLLVTGVLGIVAVRFMAERVTVGIDYDLGSPLHRLHLAAGAIGFYAWKTLWPTSLAAVYAHDLIDGPAWRSAAIWAALLVIAALAWILRRRGGLPLLLTLACTLVMLLPVLYVSNQGLYLRSLVGDRYMHLPLIFPLALLVSTGCLAASGAAAKRRALAIVAGVLMLAWSGLSLAHSQHYASQPAMWKVTLKHQPGAWYAHHAMAGMLIGYKPAEADAIRHAQLAAQGEPSFPPNFYVLSMLQLQMGDDAGATASLREAVRLLPSYAQAHLALGRVLWLQDDLEGAAAALEKAATYEQTAQLASQELGWVRLLLGQYRDAEQPLLTVLQKNPGWVEGHLGLAAARAGQGDLPRARILLQKAAALPMNPSQSLRARAWWGVVQGQPRDEALAAFEAAAKAFPVDRRALEDVQIARRLLSGTP